MRGQSCVEPPLNGARTDNENWMGSLRGASTMCWSRCRGCYRSHCCSSAVRSLVTSGGVNTIVAFVVLGVTSFGVVFYAFIVVTGMVSESCPYQTPGARILRHTLSALLPVLAAPQYCHLLKLWRPSFRRPWFSMKNIGCFWQDDVPLGYGHLP